VRTARELIEGRLAVDVDGCTEERGARFSPAHGMLADHQRSVGPAERRCELERSPRRTGFRTLQETRVCVGVDVSAASRSGQHAPRDRVDAHQELERASGA
jgi:hypothetical protein